jgi:hypothetical protein
VSAPVGIQGEFKAEQAWDAMVVLAAAQLDQVDVAKIADKDFNDQGEMIMNPPSARVLFFGEKALSTSDSQRRSYNSIYMFLILVADQDLSGSSANQAEASLMLATRVKAIFNGARIVLADGDISEPITYTGIEAVPAAGVGMAYAVAFEVPGLAQFPATNSYPLGGD